MIKVGVLSFSDGRERVHETLREYIQACEETLCQALADTGEVELLPASEIVCSNDSARRMGEELRSKNPEVCIFNIPVFAFPNFSVLSATILHTPLLACAPVNGSYPGLGGLQAGVNFLHQAGVQCEKVWGDPGDADTMGAILSFLRAAGAASRLTGQVYGLIGGRSIGMGSGTMNPDLWMRQFGVDVEHIDQLEILRRAELVDDAQARKGVEWLEQHVKQICYDGGKLTPETLARQVKCYCALRELIRERGLSFVGMKCHYELSEYYDAQCLSAALCNDPYDWNGPKPPTVFACEADSDAALTMQIMGLISGKPALFMDFRHYMKQENLFAFCNCGSCATWFASRSDCAADNLREVTLFPLIPKYAGNGCHVQFIARAGEMTFARLTHVGDLYKLQAFRGEFQPMDPKRLSDTCPAWPHGFARVDSDAVELVNRYESNHIHAVEGNYMNELEKFCKLKGILFEKL